MRKGFTLIELIVVVFIGGIALTILGVGGSWLFSGCSSTIGDNMIVNPFHTSSAKIQVQTTYFGVGELGNTYRVFATIVEDTDGGIGTETFEVSDSFIDGNYRTADLFGELRASEQTGRVYEVDLRGERSGISGAGSFRQIRSVTMVGEPE